MATRKFLAAALIAGASGLGGCKIVSDPPKRMIAQDVEFLRGCWVAKAGPNGPVTAFLRLLPDGADGLSYQGYLQTIQGSEVAGSVHVAFARDGSSVTLREPRGGPSLPTDAVGGAARLHASLPDALLPDLPKAEHRVTYAASEGRPPAQFIVAEGGEETLSIRLLGGAGQEMGDIFRGERDGCD